MSGGMAWTVRTDSLELWQDLVFHGMGNLRSIPNHAASVAVGNCGDYNRLEVGEPFLKPFLALI